MEKLRRIAALEIEVDPEPTAPGLPEFAAVVHPVEQTHVLVRRGYRGYWSMPDGVTAEALNEGLTEAQLRAMEGGSLFGWGLPIANPERRASA